MSTERRNGRICVTWAVEVSAPALQISPIPLTSMFAEYLWILFLKIKITLFADIYRTSVVHKTLTSSASQLRRKKQWDIAVHYPITLILYRHPLLPPSFHYFLPYYTRACVCVCVCENIMRCPHCPLCTCSTIHDFIFARVAPACVGIWKTPSRIYQPVSFHPAAEYHCNVR